jgi:hypothetical protein
MMRRYNNSLIALIAVSCLMCSNPISKKVEEVSNPVVISEILYNNGADSLEFIELKNNTSEVLSLKGMKFVDGVTYTFPDSAHIAPESYMILTNSLTLFKQKYPGIQVAGVYSGQLSNEGESVEIEDISKKKIAKIKYNNKGFWPALADGMGYTLVVMNEMNPGDQNDFQDWGISSKKGGTPGSRDIPVFMKGVYINEVISSSLVNRVDKVELFNPDPSIPVDISNWVLINDRNAVLKYKIPAGTVIQPLAYFVIDAIVFKDFFTISTTRGSLYLFSALADGTLNGYSHELSYDESAEGSSWGLIKTSDNAYRITELQTASVGLPNTLPLVGELVISEIMYHPESGKPEFLEIINRSSASVNVTGWEIEGIDFSFTSSVSLSSNEIVLIINESESIDNFRRLYSIAPTVQIFQCNGKLSNDGETIAIKKPGTAYVDNNAVVRINYITVDKVSYNDKAPWPSDADGNGYSATRKDLNAYGSEPSNWANSPIVAGTPGKL